MNELDREAWDSFCLNDENNDKDKRFHGNFHRGHSTGYQQAIKDMQAQAPVVPEGWSIEPKGEGYIVLMPDSRGGVYVDMTNETKDSGSIAGITLLELCKAMLKESK